MVAATSSAAAAWTTGTSSAGTTNSVRRIAIIRTRLRSSYSSRATSSRPRCGQRASTERWTVAGSVACRTTSERAASTAVAAPARSCRCTSRARRSRTSSTVTAWRYGLTVELPDGWVAVVKRECPTCELVVPVLAQLADAGPLTVLSQDDPGFPAGLTVVDDRELERSWRLQVQTVPTLLRVEDGAEVERTEGWLRERWEALTGVAGSGSRPARAPAWLRVALGRAGARGGARAALRRTPARRAPGRAGRPRGRVRGDARPRLDRRTARRPADRGARAAHAQGHDARPRRGRRRRPARPRRVHRREGRGERGDGRLPARAPARRARRRGGGLHRGLRPARPARDDVLLRAGRRRERPGGAGGRHEQRRQRARSGQPGQRHHRPGAAAGRAQRRRRPSRRGRPGDARQPRQAHLLLRRARARLAVRAARRRTEACRRDAVR